MTHSEKIDEACDYVEDNKIIIEGYETPEQVDADVEGYEKACLFVLENILT